MANYILFISLSLFWGGSFLAIKELIHYVPPVTSAFYRVLFSFFFIIIIYRKDFKIPKGEYFKELLSSFLAGLFSIGFPFSLLFWGEQYVGASMAGILNGTVPFWTLIISLFFFDGKKEVTTSKVFGLILGFSGMLFIFYPKIAISGNTDEIKGLAALVGMAFFYALGINFNRKVLFKNKAIVKGLNTASQQFSSLILLGVILLFMEGVPDPKLLMNGKVLGSVFYLSFFSTTLAFIIFYHLIKELGPLKTSSVTFFIPVVAMFLDRVINDRILNFYEITGASIILMSMFFINGNGLNQVSKLIFLRPIKTKN